MRQKWLRHLCLVAILAMLAAACGGGGGTTEETEGGGDTEGGGSEETSEPESESEATSESESDGGEASESESSAQAPQGDGTLTIGTILPETGSLAFLGPPEFAGVQLAVNEVNEAGGVLGNDVALFQGDSGDTTTDIANQTVDRLLEQNADVIIGAASSSVSFTVIDKITGAGVVQISPANTAPDFTDYDDNGLYFRVAPSDVLQGRILAEVIAEDGNASVGIMALQDPYGEGLAQFVSENLQESGVTLAPEEPLIYDPNAQNFDAEVQQIVSANPDGVVVIGFDESARVITSLIEQGFGPGEKNVYGVDGNMGNALGEQFAGQPGALEGMKGTTPLTDLAQEFQDRMLEVDPGLVDFNYGGESYDAVIIASLAAEVAGSDAGEAIAQELAGVTKEGTKCTSFEECKGMIESGEDIDYDGVIGPIELDEAGDPTVASFAILQFGPDNALLPDPEFREATTGSG